MKLKSMNNKEKLHFFTGIICIALFIGFEIYSILAISEIISQGFGLLLWGIICLIISKAEYKKRTDKEQIEKHKKTENERIAHTPVCPICGSKKHVHRLSAIDRSISTAVLGIASSSIGKQWTCTACDHDFNVDVAIQPKPSNGKSESQQIEMSFSTTDPTTELRKYKQLLDDGVITQEDYDQKKKQLLRL